MKEILLAPLQGFTEAPVRNLFERYFGGVDTYYTPFLRLEKGNFRNKDLRDADPLSNTVTHLVPQIMASEPEEARILINRVREMGYHEVDLNMGCPFPLLVRRHKGAGILPYPDEVARMLSVINEYPDLSFSVKMRLGMHQADECLALAEILNALPLSQIVLHPRLGVQQYKGTPDWEGFSRFADVCKHPLVYNGDLQNLENLDTCSNAFPMLKGFMLGRGLLAYPWLAHEYKNGCQWTSGQKRQAVQAFHEELVSHYQQRLEGGEGQILTKLKAFWEYFLANEDPKLRKKIKKATRMDVYLQASSQLIHSI